MKLIIKDRGMGKTTQLIYISESTGFPIAVPHESMINEVKNMAENIGCNIPEPVTVYDMAKGKKRGKHMYDNILIDEVTLNGVLKDALNMYLNSNVVACTCSPDYIYEESMKIYSNDFDNWPKRNITVSCS